MSADPAVAHGAVDTEVARELRGLRIAWLDVPAAHGGVPRGLRRRLRDLSGRWHGARAVTMRQEAVPHAYRVLFRHLGLDPDEDRPPQEAAVVARLTAGGFRAGTVLEAALLVAVVETGVPVRAIDADAAPGGLGVRPARAGERLGEGELAHDLVPGRLVVTAGDRPVAVLFGDLAPEVVPHRRSARLRLYAVGAPGVPELHLEEALWLAHEALEGGADAR